MALFESERRMKKTQYSYEQIVQILRETDKGTVAEVAKRQGVSEANACLWSDSETGWKPG